MYGTTIVITDISTGNLLMAVVMVAVGSSEYLGRRNTVVHAAIPIIDPVAEVAVACVVISGATTLECPHPILFPIVMDTFHTSKNFVSWTLKH